MIGIVETHFLYFCYREESTYGTLLEIEEYICDYKTFDIPTLIEQWIHWKL
jgi:hypothetical protein